MRFEALTVVDMSMLVFWVVKPSDSRFFSEYISELRKDR
jgi:hypothetical protein